MQWFGEGWTRLHRITDRDEDPWFRSCEDRPGLYRLTALTDAAMPTLAPLQRVCGPDASGTIYIGVAGNLRPRIGQLVLQHHHELFAGGGHRPMPVRLEQDFPAAKLAVCWRYLPGDVDRYAEERRLIRAYTDAFGEPPPLNTMP